MIEIDGLIKRYGEKAAVNGLSFVVEPGVVTGFLGPNGAGKSTTMRVIAGLDRPTSGTVRVNGKQYRRCAAPMSEPATVLEAAERYRAAFRPGADLDRPHVSVSADVVVASDEAAARELAAGYRLWVRSIRSGEGAIPFPTPEQARAHRWTDADRAMVADRVDTQFTGSPKQVADQLEQLQEATGADELIITTITHDHADRVRSYRLLAEEWRRR